MSDREIRIIFFGDSICVGQNVSIHNGWITRLSAHIEEVSRKLDRRITVMNASANGRTTRQALEVMPYEVQSHQPDILLVQYGMNDCNYWESDLGLPRVSIDAFRANLMEIIMRGFVSGARTIFLNTNHPTCRTEPFKHHPAMTYEASNRAYNEVIREVANAADDQVRLTDIEIEFQRHCEAQEVPVSSLQLDPPDNIHLNENGHSLYYDTLRTPIEEVIRAACRSHAVA